MLQNNLAYNLMHIHNYTLSVCWCDMHRIDANVFIILIHNKRVAYTCIRKLLFGFVHRRVRLCIFVNALPRYGAYHPNSIHKILVRACKHTLDVCTDTLEQLLVLRPVLISKQQIKHFRLVLARAAIEMPWNGSENASLAYMWLNAIAAFDFSMRRWCPEYLVRTSWRASDDVSVHICPSV